MRSLIQRSLTTTIILFACAQMALAQATSGSVRGAVSDQNGAAIARAAVTVRHVETNAERRLTANNEGAYLADNLPPGEYEILVEAPGFQKHLRRVEVLTNSNATVDLTLNVGANAETVEVAGGAAQINTSDYKVDGVITRERIEDLPLNGRSFLSLASLEPGVGVEYSPSGGPGGQNNFFRVSIGGSPQAMTRISVDGAMVNNRITGGTSQNFSQETVQEFQISSFNFDLSVGNTAVGAVNIVSRTGGNAFHGSGFFFYRDHNIAAYPALRRPCDPVARNPRCDNPAAIPRLEDPFFARRNSGVNASGPIKKDRLFFFSNFEYTNQVGARTVTHSNPIFFGYNHTAQQPFRGHLFNTRLDFRLNEKHNGFLRYSHDYNRNLAPGAAVTLESGWISTRNFAYQGTLGLTSVLSPRLVNEFRYSYLFHNYKLNPPSASECTEPL